MYANVAQLSQDSTLLEAYNMITKNAAKLLNIPTEIRVGKPANFVILEAKNAVEAVRTISQPLIGFKNGKQTFSNSKAEIYFN
jgi:cytosine deaminase